MLSYPVKINIRAKKSHLQAWANYFCELHQDETIVIERLIGPRKVARSERSYYLKVEASLVFPDDPNPFASEE